MSDILPPVCDLGAVFLLHFTISSIMPQRKNAGGRKSEQHPYHPHPKPSSVQSAVGGVHWESVSTATSKHARIDHQPSKQSSSARNEPSLSPSSMSINQTQNNIVSFQHHYVSSVDKCDRAQHFQQGMTIFHNRIFVCSTCTEIVMYIC